MTDQRNPDDLRKRSYSIRDDAGSIVLPMIVASALVVFIGYLLLGPTFDAPHDRAITAPRAELPNTNPAAPPVPMPTPPPQQ